MKDPIPKGRTFNPFRLNFAKGLKNPLRTNRNISPALAFPEMNLVTDAVYLEALLAETTLPPMVRVPLVKSIPVFIPLPNCPDLGIFVVVDVGG